MESGSSASGLNGKKSDRSRRSWSQHEEQVLIAALKELIVQGWKSDNGFRAGYLMQLEEAMKNTFPNTDLKGTPHINSRLCSWKKNYYSLNQILARSGVGFNLRGTHTIECEDDQWEQIVKIDNNARLMRFKSWPYYEDWKDIFGKDRATGEAAEDFVEAWNDLKDTDPLVDGGFDIGIDVPLEHEQADSASETKSQPHMSTHKGKKRRSNDEMEGVCKVLGEIGNKADARLAELVKRIGYEFDLGKARQEVFVKLGEIPGLSIDQRFDVCEMLGKEVSQLQIFMGLPNEAQPLYVNRLLKNKGK